MLTNIAWMRPLPGMALLFLLSSAIPLSAAPLTANDKNLLNRGVVTPNMASALTSQGITMMPDSTGKMVPVRNGYVVSLNASNNFTPTATPAPTAPSGSKSLTNINIAQGTPSQATSNTAALTTNTQNQTSIPDAQTSNGMTGRPTTGSGLPATQGNLSTLMSPQITVMPSKDGSMISPCSSNCSGNPYVVKYQDSNGVMQSLPLSKEEAGAYYAISNASNGGVSTESNNFMNTLTAEERLMAGVIAEKTVATSTGDPGAGTDVRNQAVLGAVSAASGQQGEVSPEDASYFNAVAAANLSTAIPARGALLDSKTNEFKAMGYSDEEATAMAQQYIAVGYDTPLASGVDAGGMIEANQVAQQFDGIPASPYPVAGSSDGHLSPAQATSLIAAGTAMANDPQWLNNLAAGKGAGDNWTAASSSAANAFTQAAGFTGDTNVAATSGALKSVSPGGMVASTGYGYTPPAVSSSNGVALNGGMTSTPTNGNTIANSGDDWVSHIRLPKTDLFVTLATRWFGAPVESIYDHVFDSSGVFKDHQGAIKSTSQKAPTATLFVIKILIYPTLFIAAILLTYFFIYGMYRSAKDGQLMGKDWNIAFTAGRSSVGVGLLFPIPALGGITGAQAIVLMAALAGTAVASTAALFASYYMLSTPAVEPVATFNEGFVASVAKANACVVLLQKEGNKIPSKPLVDTFDGTGASTAESGASLPKSGSGVFSWFSSLFAGPVDPLASSNVDTRTSAIGKVYKQTGINPLLFTIKRYKYGENSECGALYLPGQYKKITADKLAKRVSFEVFGRTESGYMSGHMSQSGNWGLGGGQTENGALATASSATNTIGSYTAGLSSSSYEVVTFRSIQESGTEQWVNTINTAKYAALNTAFINMNTSTREAISKYVNSNPMAPGVLAGTLTEIQSKFYDALTAGVASQQLKTANPANKVTLDAIGSLGWMSIGPMYWSFESRQKEIVSFYDFSELKNVTLGGPSSINSSMVDSEGKVTPQSIEDTPEIQIEYQSISEIIDRGIGPTGIRFAYAQFSNASPDSAGVGGTISDWVASTIIESSSLADAKNFNVSPIDRVRQLGVNITNAFGVATMALMIGKAATATAKETPGLGFFAAAGYSLFTDILSMLLEATKLLLGGAFICANIIPAMPYIMFMAAAIGYLIYLLEALVGANFWILMHAHPDGHDIWGKGGAGYPIILTLMLRPSLIVIGFFAGLGLNWIFGHFINITILPAMNTQNAGGGWIGNLSQFAGVIVVFTGLHLFACYKSFSLTWELPNAVTRWMGVNDHQDLGEREVKETSLGVSAGVGGIGRTMMVNGKPRARPGKGGDGAGGDGAGGDGAGGGNGGVGDAQSPNGGGQTNKGAAQNVNMQQPTTGKGDGKDGV